MEVVTGRSQSPLMASPDLRLRAANLSKADVEEIKKFAQGKTRMEEHSQYLLRRPLVDAFADFQRVDIDGEPDAARLQTAWNGLDKGMIDVQSWQDECDSIELDLSQLEVEDMTQLRMLTKAAIQREMSPEDTDLVEVAIHTLTALDMLKRHLATRQRELDVLSARLCWECERRQCWRSFVALKRDFETFKNVSGRWKDSLSSPAKYRSAMEESADDEGVEVDGLANKRDVATPSKDISTLTAHSPTGPIFGNGKMNTQHAAFLQGEVEQLAHRSHAFIAERVPLAEARLDKIIELCKVPEAFLDEQDRLDDLAEAVKKKLTVVAQLSRQWRWAEKSDALSKLLNTLKIDTKGLGRGEKDDKSGGSADQISKSTISKGDKLVADAKVFAGEPSNSTSVADADLKTSSQFVAVSEDASAPAVAADSVSTFLASRAWKSNGPHDLTENHVSCNGNEAASNAEQDKEARLDDTSFSSEDHGSSLPSLSSAESLGDVFVVSGTPPLSRMSSTSSEQRVFSALQPVVKSSTHDRSSDGAILSIDSVVASARRIVSDSAVLHLGHSSTPLRRGQYRSQLRSTPSRLPVPITPRNGGGERTPTSLAESQRHTIVAPLGRMDFQSAAASGTPIDSSATYSMSSTSHARSRRLSASSTNYPTVGVGKRGPNRYKANPKSKLDVMVGQIVNKLHIPVSITHAAAVSPTPTVTAGTPSSSSSGRGSAASSTRTRDEHHEQRSREKWHDESGRYWVGHPDPKLCFCRVLRSKTVMVRVGGGWEELSSYIVKHYAHLAPNETLSAAASPQNSPRVRKNSSALDSLPWINSSSLLAASTPKHSPEDIFGTSRSFATGADASPTASRGITARASRSSTMATPTGGGGARIDLHTSPAAPQSSTMLAFPPSSDGVSDGMNPDTMSAFWLRKDKVQPQQQRAMSSSMNKPDPTSPSRKSSNAKQPQPPPIGMPSTRRPSGQRERLRALSSVR